MMYKTLKIKSLYSGLKWWKNDKIDLTSFDWMNKLKK